MMKCQPISGQDLQIIIGYSEFVIQYSSLDGTEPSHPATVLR